MKGGVKQITILLEEACSSEEAKALGEAIMRLRNVQQYIMGDPTRSDAEARWGAQRTYDDMVRVLNKALVEWAENSDIIVREDGMHPTIGKTKSLN